MIEYTNLAPGLRIARVLNGLWQIADLERNGNNLDASSTAAYMLPYSEAGFTTFDMADHYGSAEDIAGAFTQQFSHKQPVQLLTKWVPSPGPLTKSDVREAVQRALSRVKCNTIDLMQFHAWNYADPRWLEALFWLTELKHEGLIQHLGLTNFDTAHLHIAVTSGIPVISNQICYSLLDQRASGAMKEVCLQYNVRVLAFGTLAGGFLSNKWLNQPEPLLSERLTWSQMKYKRFIDAAGGWQKFQEVLRVLHEVASSLGVSISNVASRFILEQPHVAGIIIGARLGQSEHIHENEKLFSFHLSPAHQQLIAQALTQLHTIPGDCGDEYRKPPYLTASGDLSHHVNHFPLPYPTHTDATGKTKALSGTVWEDIAGFSRAVRKGDRILISGTTATHGNRSIGGNNAAAQTHFAIDKIEGALQSLGSKLDDVIRTRIYIRHISDWETVARAHGQRFKTIQPVNTMIQANLIGDEYLVEIEAEAITE